MIIAEDILITLEENLNKILAELGTDRGVFLQELAPLLNAFANINDRNALELAADQVWQLCCRYPSAKKLIQEHSTQHQKRPPSGDFGGEEISIRETANHFQSLLEDLEEIDQKTSPQQPSGNPEQPGRNQ